MAAICEKGTMFEDQKLVVAWSCSSRTGHAFYFLGSHVLCAVFGYDVRYGVQCYALGIL